MEIRPRRLRKNNIIRELVSETKLSLNQLIYPIFLVPGMNIKSTIHSLDGQFHFSIDTVLEEVQECMELGINKFLIFGTGEEKSDDARSAYALDSLVSEGIRAIKARFGKNVYLISDVCTCAYTSHGHCGIVVGGEVDNDLTLDILVKMSISHARAGVDMVAPSDMMDGRIGAIRKALDQENLTEVGIMSYSVKFASAYYGPFRDAAGSAPEFGDRRSYQMDYRNPKEALREAQLDEEEGADILMVKPGMAYLDIIQDVSRNTYLPVAAYNVSGEYAMVKAASKMGLVDEKTLVIENMFSLTRAGASIIITYHAKDIAKNNWLN